MAVVIDELLQEPALPFIMNCGSTLIPVTCKDSRGRLYHPYAGDL